MASKKAAKKRLSRKDIGKQRGTWVYCTQIDKFFRSSDDFSEEIGIGKTTGSRVFGNPKFAKSVYSIDLVTILPSSVGAIIKDWFYKLGNDREERLAKLKSFCEKVK